MTQNQFENYSRKLLALIFFWCLIAPSAFAGKVITQVVLDLDWTVIYPVSAEAAQVEPESIVQSGSDFFRFSDHAVETVAALHAAGFRVAYFSGGTRDRNAAVITELYKRLVAHYRSIGAEGWRPWAVGDVTHLEPWGNDPKARFAERLKKNLLRWQPNIDLANTVLVDDVRLFAPEPRNGEIDQRRGLLWIQKTYEDILDYEKWERNTEPSKRNQYHPPSRAAWGLERNKLPWALGVILSATEMRDRGGVGFHDAMVSLTRDANNEPIPATESSQRRLTERGLQRIGLRSDPTLRSLETKSSSCDLLEFGWINSSPSFDSSAVGTNLPPTAPHY